MNDAATDEEWCDAAHAGRPCWCSGRAALTLLSQRALSAQEHAVRVRCGLVRPGLRGGHRGRRGHLRRAGEPARTARVWATERVEEAARQRLQAEALEQLVKQQIVLAALEKRGEACSAAAARTGDCRGSRTNWAVRRKSLEEYCRAKGVPCAGIGAHDALAVELEQLSGEIADGRRTCGSILRSHRADFDGTKMRVAQILLAWPDDAAERAKVEQQARAIRDEILAGKISFAAAAQQVLAVSQRPRGRRARRGSRATSRCRSSLRRPHFGSPRGGNQSAGRQSAGRAPDSMRGDRAGPEDVAGRCATN